MADSLAAELIPLVESAGMALDLLCHVSGIRICGDDLPGENGFWWRLEPGFRRGELPVLVLFCHEGCFGCRGLWTATVNPPREIWEQAPAQLEDCGGDETEFSAEGSAVFLHHHLLTARDIIRGDLVGRNLPGAQVEAFSEVWAVSVDGRLARQGLPGYSLAERRGKFVRVFSPAGILLPDHWQIFQSIWDGALSSQKDIQEIVKRLPGL